MVFSKGGNSRGRSTWGGPKKIPSLNTSLSPKTATDFSGPKSVSHTWHHSVDKKHHFCYVQFEIKKSYVFLLRIDGKASLVARNGI
jgi:hypothetical protein